MLFALLTVAAGCGGGDDGSSRSGVVGDDDDDSSVPDDDATDDDTGDDDTTDDDTGDDDTGDDDTGDDDTGDDDTQEATVTLHVTDGETAADIEGATCTVIDGATGEPVGPENSADTDADGVCTLTLAGSTGQEAIRIVATDYVTAYNFAVAVNTTIEQILIKADSRDALATALSVTIDPLDGIVIGVVLWSGSSGVEFVGCAEITNDSGQSDVFYSDATGFPIDSRTSTNPANSAYLLFNVPSGGPYTFTADADGEITEADAPKVFAEAMTFVYLMYPEETWPDNPTPGGCS